jgi:uncharacterized protein YjbI with pentapeptide repeats
MTLARVAQVAVSVFLICVLWLPVRGTDAASCSFESASTDPKAPFTRHLPASCTQEERDAHPVHAQELMAVLVEGKGIDLAGVVVTGDLMLDQLPLEPVASLDFRSTRLKEAVETQHLDEVRVIGGPIAIRDSRVRGKIATNIKDGLVIVRGPVTMGGTTFEHLVDLSHCAFLAMVDFSDSILLREGFFIRTLFTQPARFERTAFGIHSRFHRAVFADTVSFLRAGFNGLSEFLEASFEKDASFSRTYFKMGTGFSASRFQGGLDFSEATFEREAFFLFTRFEGDVYFRRATFRAEADFSDAEFRGLDDFSKVFFEVPPKFVGTKKNPDRRTLGGLQNPKVLYAIAAAILVFTLGFILLLRKM